MVIPTDIGGEIAVKIGTAPGDKGAGTVNGSAIDRKGFDSCVLFAHTGSISGSPTAQTVDAKLQESADGSTGWTDISGAAIDQITAADTKEEKDVNLRGAKRYIRVVEVVGFTGGTSPTIGVATAVVLGGAREKPAA